MTDSPPTGCEKKLGPTTPSEAERSLLYAALVGYAASPAAPGSPLTGRPVHPSADRKLASRPPT
jgi:hypothetical protein